MASAAMQAVAPAAEEAVGDNRATVELGGSSAGGPGIKTPGGGGGGREMAFSEAATSAASSVSAAKQTGQPTAGTKDLGIIRGNERKYTRLRSAAHSLANGVTRMHSRLRAATTGSTLGAATKGVSTTGAEGGVPSSAAQPLGHPTPLCTTAPSPSCSSFPSSAAVGRDCSKNLLEGQVLYASQMGTEGQHCSATLSGNADQSLSGLPDRLLERVDEGDETEAQQQYYDVVTSKVLPPPSIAADTPAVVVGAQQTAASGQIPEEVPTATENASPATTATRASVMSTDLGGFYRKLLGEDWQEQLKELNEESNPLLEEDGPGGAAGGAAASLGGAAAAGDELQLPDNYQGKMRQRIRRRDVSDKPRDISDQVADDLHFGQDEEPLITPEDIAVIREQAWIPAGEGIPDISEMELGYHRAWDVGKKGCLAIKVDGLWDSALKGNKMRFFVMDGTDPESFLSFYSKSDLHAARGLQSERLGTLTAWDLRDGYWNYMKKKIFVKRSNGKGKKKDCILEGFTAEFYDAMLLCIWEMCVQAATEQLKHERRRERARRRQSLAIGLGGSPSGERRRSQTPVGGGTRRVSASLRVYKDLPRRGGAGGGGGGEKAGGGKGGRGGASFGSNGGLFSAPKRVGGTAAGHQEKAAAAAAQHREIMKQLIREGRMLLARPRYSRRKSGGKRSGGGRMSTLRVVGARRERRVKGGGGGGPLPMTTTTTTTTTGASQHITHYKQANGVKRQQKILPLIHEDDAGLVLNDGNEEDAVVGVPLHAANQRTTSIAFA